MMEMNLGFNGLVCSLSIHFLSYFFMWKCKKSVEMEGGVGRVKKCTQSGSQRGQSRHYTSALHHDSDGLPRHVAAVSHYFMDKIAQVSAGA